jgi:hypothetical protein
MRRLNSSCKGQIIAWLRDSSHISGSTEKCVVSHGGLGGRQQTEELKFPNFGHQPDQCTPSITPPSCSLYGKARGLHTWATRSPTPYSRGIPGGERWYGGRVYPASNYDGGERQTAEHTVPDAEEDEEEEGPDEFDGAGGVRFQVLDAALPHVVREPIHDYELMTSDENTLA